MANHHQKRTKSLIHYATSSVSGTIRLYIVDEIVQVLTLHVAVKSIGRFQ